jgi:hypothetical protein
MQVKRCFGHSGEKDCLMFLCNCPAECYECYLKWYRLTKKDYYIRLREVIENYMKDNKITYRY